MTIFFSITRPKKNMDLYKILYILDVSIRTHKQDRMSELLLFFRCFMMKGPLLYQGVQKIKSHFYFSICRHKKNVDLLMISYVLDVSIKRHTNKKE